MPVSVHLPTRICVDSGVLHGDGRVDLADAITRASGRALKQARESVLAPRGGYVGVRLHCPMFSWSGDGLGQVSATVQREIEELATSALLDAVASSGIFDFAQLGEECDPPFAGEATESLDADRHYAHFRIYAVPGYQGRGTALPVTAIDFDEPEVVEASGITKWEWIPVSTPGLGTIVIEAAQLTGIDIPNQGYMGIIFHTPRGIAIQVYTRPDMVLTVNLPPTLPTNFEYEGEPGNGRYVTKSVSYSAGSTFRLRWLAPANSPEGRKTTLQAYFRPRVESHLVAAWERMKAGKHKSLMTEAEFRDQLPDAIDHYVSGIVDNFESQHGASGKLTCFFILEIDGGETLGYTDSVIPEGLDIDLIPVAKLVTTKVDKTKEKGGGGGDGEGGPGDGGTREGAGGGAGKGTGTGTAPGGKPAGRGAIVQVPGAPTQSGSSARFPSIAGKGDIRGCQPFFGEPSLDDLGPDANSVRQQIEEIAGKLDIEPCFYPGNFCLIAAQVLAARTAAVSIASSSDAAYTTPASDGTGNMGFVEFRITASPGIQLLRHLATVVPLLDGYFANVTAYMRDPAHHMLIQDGYPGWLLHLAIDFTNLMESAVARLFTQTCRVVLLQMLRSSKKSIDDGLANLEQTRPFFESVIRYLIVDIGELQDLRRTLKDSMPTSTLDSIAQGAADAWREVHYDITWWDSANRIVDLFDKPEPVRPDAENLPAGVVEEGGKVIGIRDTFGKTWTLRELDEAIMMREAIGQTIHPFVKQIVQTPGMIERFKRNRKTIGLELRHLLEEMKASNEEVVQRVVSDHMYAFRIQALGDKLPGLLTPVSAYPLQGIHHQAYLQIGEFFEGTDSFARGMRHLFGSEMGRRDLLQYTEIAGVIALSIACAPLGIAVGTAFAGAHLHEAYEKQQVMTAVLDPGEVTSRADLEAELFAAQLGAALSILPVKGLLGKPVSQGARAAARSGIREGAQVFATGVRRRSLVLFAQGVKQGLYSSVTREVATMAFMDQAMQHLVTGPFADALRREFPVYDEFDDEPRRE